MRRDARDLVEATQLQSKQPLRELQRAQRLRAAVRGEQLPAALRVRHAQQAQQREQARELRVGVAGKRRGLEQRRGEACGV